MNVNPLSTKIGIIAPGTIGAPLAILFAICGFRDIVLEGYDEEKLPKSFRKNGLAELLKLISKGTISPLAWRRVEQRVRFAVGIPALMDREILIECGPEGGGWKQRTYLEIRQAFGDLIDQLFVFTTTSSNDVDRLGAESTFPTRFGGLHVINPVLTCPALELFICNQATEETNDVMRQLGRLLGKTIAEVPGCLPGGYLNDTAFAAASRGFERAQEVAEIWPDVGLERALRDQHTMMTLGCGWPLGASPFGHFVGWDVTDEIWTNQGNPRHPAVAAAIARGELGKKTGSPQFLGNA